MPAPSHCSISSSCVLPRLTLLSKGLPCSTLSQAHESILELQSVTYPNGKLTISRWIDMFPFPYYVVVRDLRNLPRILSEALRQWMATAAGLE